QRRLRPAQRLHDARGHHSVRRQPPQRVTLREQEHPLCPEPGEEVRRRHTSPSDSKSSPAEEGGGGGVIPPSAQLHDCTSSAGSGSSSTSPGMLSSNTSR